MKDLRLGGGNQLDGSIPPQLGKMAELSRFNGGSGHTGCLPDALSRFATQFPALPACGDSDTSTSPASTPVPTPAATPTTVPKD